ncbi:MAG: hydroxymethylbilane synthase [Burkholderiales bacterium]|nr:hydroxymethylbilane synthase [Phycisphaerae bacterium]
MSITTLRLGTRGSLLARAQSQLVAGAIELANDGVRVELVILKTTGDRVQDKSLADLGGKGLFTKELEQALLRGEIDLAVHSYKDVPVTMPLVDQANLVITAVPRREDPRDVLIVRGDARAIAELQANARVGTGSLRRRCQLLAIREDLMIEPIRGNIDTRLSKLGNGDFDAIVLAYAGLKRTGLYDAACSTILPADQLIPSPGQGALALQTRRDDPATHRLLEPLHDAETGLCVDTEREVVRLLNGDCHSPIAAHATVAGDRLTLVAAVGQENGQLPVVRALQNGAVTDHQWIAEIVASRLIKA